MIKLAPTHKIVLAFALYHLLERLFAVPAFRLRLGLVQFGPILRRMPDEPGHLGQQTGVIVFGRHG